MIFGILIFRILIFGILFSEFWFSECWFSKFWFSEFWFSECWFSEFWFSECWFSEFWFSEYWFSEFSRFQKYAGVRLNYWANRTRTQESAMAGLYIIYITIVVFCFAFRTLISHSSKENSGIKNHQIATSVM